MATLSTQEQKQQNNLDVNGKIIVVLTGATGSIGGAIASGLIAKPNISLHLLARNENKVKLLIENKLKNVAHSTSIIKYHLVDLSSKVSINKFVQNFCLTNKYVDILINDAAIVPKIYKLSVDNEELQFSVNVMSYIRLMSGLLPLLINSGLDKEHRRSQNKVKGLKEFGSCCKIINVASRYTTNLINNLSITLQGNQNNYNSNNQYKKTKTADRMLSYKASQIYKKNGYNIGVYSCHPGVTASNVLTGLGFGSGWETAISAAKTPLYIATNKSIGMQQTGCYFMNCSARNCQYCKDQDKVNKLWNYLCKLL